MPAEVVAINGRKLQALYAAFVEHYVGNAAKLGAIAVRSENIVAQAV